MQNIAVVFRRSICLLELNRKRKKQFRDLHSPEYQFDDTVLAGAAAAFANIAIHGCMGELKEN